MHGYLDKPLTITRFTAPPLDIEAEPARFKTPRPCFRQPGEQITYRGEYAGIGCRI